MALIAAEEPCNLCAPFVIIACKKLTHTKRVVQSYYNTTPEAIPYTFDHNVV